MASPIFIVDSSPAVRRLVEQISIPEGFEVIGFQDGPAALEAAKQSNPKLIIADYNLDNITFSGFCKEINKLDHLTETYLITLINSADHPDEGHLRSLGVKAFLKKPFQPDDLLGLIKSVPQKQSPTAISSASGTGLKRRAWPPSADDDEQNGPPTTVSTELHRPQAKPTDPPKIEISPFPLSAQTSAPGSSPMTNQMTPGPQDAMKGLFDQLMLSVAKETEKRLADVLPRLVEDKLTSHVRPVIQNEVRGQLGSILSVEQLAAIIRPILSQELPSLLGKELTKCEPLLRQAASDATRAMVTEHVNQWVREQAEGTIQKQLPDLIQKQAGSIDQILKDEVRTAVAQHGPLLADDIVRTTAEQSVEQSVQRIVPDLAERHIQAELKRLTAPD